MSIDRIYREFFGFSLIIFSLFLLTSLFTFSAQDNVINIFNEDTTYLNNFGYLGALFSNGLFSYIGLSAYYFCLMSFYFGMVIFFTKPPKTFTEKLTSFNNFLFSLVSLFPLSLSSHH